MRLLLLLIITLVPLSTPALSQPELAVSLCTSEGSHDDYTLELLRLALEKTRTKYGNYHLSKAINLPEIRQAAVIQQNPQQNLVAALGWRQSLETSGDLTFINFPLELGVQGWRACFTNNQTKEKLKKVESLEELRHFSIIQGLNWSDNSILRANGFRIIENERFLSLFNIVANGGADLFCRGINELKTEYTQHHKIKNLTLDERFLLVYDMPIFFYLNKTNSNTKQRIEEGLKIAYSDGSLVKLLLNRYRDSIVFSKLHQRQIIHLTNSQTETAPVGYKHYQINPLSIK